MAFRLDNSGLLSGLRELDSRAEVALLIYTETEAKRFEAYAKANRLWTDRTGHAKQRMKGTSRRTERGFRIELAHGVDYGIWLEFANEKKYAIIFPTIYANQESAINGFKQLLERIR